LPGALGEGDGAVKGRQARRKFAIMGFGFGERVFNEPVSVRQVAQNLGVDVILAK